MSLSLNRETRDRGVERDTTASPLLDRISQTETRLFVLAIELLGHVETRGAADEVWSLAANVAIRRLTLHGVERALVEHIDRRAGLVEIALSVIVRSALSLAWSSLADAEIAWNEASYRLLFQRARCLLSVWPEADRPRWEVSGARRSAR